ncbi:MAG: hypothetical protein LBD88_03535 [Candidatus Peribacteria bacterium]|jgi:hypothetical protein|nr:hypothetical protein [Candidatus Peribacteria bacterium]
MRKIILSGVIFVCLVSMSFANNIEDTSIIDELDKNKPQILTSDFKLQTFESCSDMQSVMKEYIKLYWENSRQNYYFGVDSMIRANAVSDKAVVAEENTAAAPTGGAGEA